MKVLSWIFQPPNAEWDIARENMQADFGEFVFRLTEMVLVCGAVVYIEHKVKAPPVASPCLAAFVAIFARSRATAGLLRLMREHNLTPVRQTLAYWLIQALTIALWVGIVIITQKIVPQIANAQA